MGKTTLVKTISIALGCQSGRIQFVPDLLPSDIIGMRIYNQKTGDFELRQGPVMTNLLLADEINRAIPRTQSALLEAMEERQISIDGEQFPLPAPFLVLATQNPVESESTFRLPAAQMDRFLIRISMGYPTPKEERRMLRNLGDETPLTRCGRSPMPRSWWRPSGRQPGTPVRRGGRLHRGAGRRHPKPSPTEDGGKPRATRGLYRAAKVWAAMEGRDFVTPDDVKTLAAPVLEHRLILDSGARFSGVSVSAILDDVLERLQGAPELEAVAHEK